MRTVLGIDAAWTVKQPSGVALLREGEAGWQVVAAAPSYSSFLGLAEGREVGWGDRSGGVMLLHRCVTDRLPPETEAGWRFNDLDDGLDRVVELRPAKPGSPPWTEVG